MVQQSGSIHCNHQKKVYQHCVLITLRQRYAVVVCICIITARIRRMGKVLFSQACVCPRGGGGGESYPMVSGLRFLPWSFVPGPFQWVCYPSPVTGPVQSSVLGPALGAAEGCTPVLPMGRGVPLPRTGVSPSQDWSTPQDRTGYPPGQDRGTPNLHRTRAVVRHGVVCLLRLHRWTFLLRQC